MNVSTAGIRRKLTFRVKGGVNASCIIQLHLHLLWSNFHVILNFTLN